MARFISYFDPFNKIPHSINGYLENACLFFSQNNLIDLTYESIEALNGHFKGLVVYRDNERQRIHHDNKLIVISDGNPLVGNKFIACYI